jgi:hypothetical protein
VSGGRAAGAWGRRARLLPAVPAAPPLPTRLVCASDLQAPGGSCWRCWRAGHGLVCFGAGAALVAMPGRSAGPGPWGGCTGARCWVDGWMGGAVPLPGLVPACSLRGDPQPGPPPSPLLLPPPRPGSQRSCASGARTRARCSWRRQSSSSRPPPRRTTHWTWACTRWAPGGGGQEGGGQPGAWEGARIVRPDSAREIIGQSSAGQPAG